MRDAGQVVAAVERAAGAPGGLRIAVSCAGTGSGEKVAGSRGGHSLEAFERVIATVPDELRERLGRSVPYPPRLGQPDEYALLVEQIVRNRMLNGETIRLDGALRMAPR